MSLNGRLQQIFDNYPKAKKVWSYVRKYTLPGFDGIPVFTVIRFIAEELKKDLIPTRARSIAFSFFIAFFPGMIFLLTLLPYIPLEGVQSHFFSLINEVFPDKVVNSFILTTVDDLLNQPREGLLSFGAILTLYFSTQGVVSMILSFNKTYSIYTDRNFFTLRWVALKLTVLLFFMFVASIVILIAGEWLINHFLNYIEVTSFWVNLLLNSLRYFIILVLFFVSISTIYRYGPAAKKKWSFITPGSTLATIGSIVASIIFSNYISGFERYNTVYGVFGSIILFLGWLYVNAFVLLIGFELNAAIYYQKAILRDKDDE